MSILCNILQNMFAAVKGDFLCHKIYDTIKYKLQSISYRLQRSQKCEYGSINTNMVQYSVEFYVYSSVAKQSWCWSRFSNAFFRNKITAFYRVKCESMFKGILVFKLSALYEQYNDFQILIPSFVVLKQCLIFVAVFLCSKNRRVKGHSHAVIGKTMTTDFLFYLRLSLL